MLQMGALKVEHRSRKSKWVSLIFWEVLKKGGGHPGKKKGRGRDWKSGEDGYQGKPVSPLLLPTFSVLSGQEGLTGAEF